MDELIKALGKFVITIFVIIFIAILLSFPTMWLWNWLMPIIFGLVKINIWQALGINILTSLLFKSNVKS